MRIAVPGILLWVVLSLPAFAGIQYINPEEGNGCGNVDATAPCYTSSSPTAQTCTARGSLGQKCRECYKNIKVNPDGSETWSYVCRQRSISLYCECDTANFGCKNVGSCTYTSS